MSLLLKCLTLLFFSSAQMNIYERQFPVCGRVNSRWFHRQRRSKFNVSSVNWVSLWRWCQKHFCCRCAEVTTGGNVVTFCRCGGIFFTSDSCREGGRAVTPSAPPPAVPLYVRGIRVCFQWAIGWNTLRRTLSQNGTSTPSDRFQPVYSLSDLQ